MARWLTQFGTISRNTYVVTLGSPFSLILQLSILAFQALLGCLPFFSFGEQLRLIRDQSLALCLLGGCLACTLGAATVVADDIRRGAAPVVMSRPIGSLCFIAGKWAGLLGSVLTIHLTASIGCLWLTKITAHEHHLDVTGFSWYIGTIIAVLLVVGIKHYLLGGCFVWQANLALLLCFGAAFLGSTQLISQPHAPVDWVTAQACLTVFFALVVYSSIMVLLALIADVGLLLGFGVILFFAGLLSEYAVRAMVFSSAVETFLRMVVPNWQLFWVNDRLAEGLSVSNRYLFHAGLHALLFALIVLIIAATIFQRRELESRI